MANGDNKRGEALRRVLLARGVECSPEDAALLTSLLLDLAVAGVLQPGLPSQTLPCALLLSETAAEGCPQAAALRAADACGQADLAKDPIVYNMGSSDYRDAL